MSREKSLIIIGLLSFVAAVLLALTVVMLVSAVQHADRWSGFVGMFFLLLAVIGAIVLVARVMSRA